MELNLVEIPQEVAAAKARLGIIGNAPALTEALTRAVRVAPIDLSVLVTGESGTGKEFFPKIIHQFSPRKHSRYIAVNCGAIPEGTIDSELFGHEKGAFTGAIATRKGYFEEADGGTIFLDEVAELPLTTQARLLRVLESGEFIKVGSSTVQKTSVRIVAATNVDLERLVREGRFRQDLFYRLSTVQINVPPLRERGNDITTLARRFAADFSERYRTPQITLTGEATRTMLHYAWPGNVRQLKNVVEQMALFEAGREIDDATLRKYLPDVPATLSPTLAGTPSTGAYEREREALFNLIWRLQSEIDDLRAIVTGRGSSVPSEEAPITPHVEVATTVTPQPTSLVKYAPTASDLPPRNARRAEADEPLPTLEENERELIRLALERNMGRRRNAAAELGFSERTLYRKIKEYNLE